MVVSNELEVSIMPRFIAVHTLPYTEEQWDEFVKTVPERLSQLPSGVKYNLTYCGFTDGKFFCDWEAPSKETVEQIFKGMEMPYDAVYPVKLFNIAKMGFED
jgi:hypothetical protein